MLAINHFKEYKTLSNEYLLENHNNTSDNKESIFESILINSFNETYKRLNSRINYNNERLSISKFKRDIDLKKSIIKKYRRIIPLEVCPFLNNVDNCITRIYNEKDSVIIYNNDKEEVHLENNLSEESKIKLHYIIYGYINDKGIIKFKVGVKIYIYSREYMESIMNKHIGSSSSLLSEEKIACYLYERDRFKTVKGIINE